MKRLDRFRRIWGENYLIGKALFPRLAEWGARQKERVVLDVGAGESPFRAWFSEAGRYIRVDFTPADNEVIAGEATDLPIENKSVDCVLLFQMLSDVPEPRDILKEAYRVLRPGGVVLIFETMSYPEHDLPHDYYRILPQGLAHLAEGCCFSVVTCDRLGGLFARFAQLWNVFLMARLAQVSLFAPPARLGIVLANMLCLTLDRLVPAPRLGTDYWAVLRKDGGGSRKLTEPDSLETGTNRSS